MGTAKNNLCGAGWRGGGKAEIQITPRRRARRSRNYIPSYHIYSPTLPAYPIYLYPKQSKKLRRDFHPASRRSNKIQKLRIIYLPTHLPTMPRQSNELSDKPREKRDREAEGGREGRGNSNRERRNAEVNSVVNGRATYCLGTYLTSKDKKMGALIRGREATRAVQAERERSTRGYKTPKRGVGRRGTEEEKSHSSMFEKEKKTKKFIQEKKNKLLAHLL